jgi:methionine-rich copper-binding protein CopC/putative copper export protein
MKNGISLYGRGMHALVHAGTRWRWRPSPAALALALGVGLAAALLLSVATAPPAHAHATLTSSDPVDQAHLDRPPPMVTVKFSEQVNPDAGGLKVINQQRREVQTMSHQSAGDTLMAMLPPDLPDGTYLANYRIISEDGHPVNGSIRFAVGNAALADMSDAAEHTDPAIDALSKIGQFLTYAGALLTAGLCFFLAFLYEPGPERRRLVLTARVGAGVAVLGMIAVVLAQSALASGGGLGSAFSGNALTTVLREGLGLQDAGVLAGLGLCLASLIVPAGVAVQSLALWGGLAATASFALWGHAVEGEWAWLKLPADAVHLVAAGVWFGGLVGLAAVLRARATTGAAPAVAGAAVAAGLPANRPADAMAASVGAPGTTAVLDPPAPSARQAAPTDGTGAVDEAEGVVLREPAPGDGDAALVVSDGPTGNGSSGQPSGNGSTAGTTPADAGADALASTVRIVRRFSAAAFVSLLALTAAGLALGLTMVGPLDEALSTSYAQLLLAKLAVVGFVGLVAGYNRFFLLPWLLTDRAETDADDRPDEDEVRGGWQVLRRTVVFEALAIVAVLGLTAVLVNTTPGAPAGNAPAGPFQQTLPLKSGGKVALTVTPNRPGENSFHIDLSGPDGKPRDVRAVQVELNQKESGVSFTREAVHGGPGHYLLEHNGDLSVGGTWDINLVVQLDQFNDEPPLTFADDLG